jgi:selenocysteine lyase/cysteine desulfurase
MNGSSTVGGENSLSYKDAIFISPHKFIGGPGTSGVLLVKKNILFSRKPQRSGGGIVLYVNELDHEYISDS